MISVTVLEGNTKTLAGRYKMNSIIPLFSYPVMVCSKNYKFSEAEKKYILDLTMADNVGNLMSSNDRVLESEKLSGLKAFIDSEISVYKNQVLRMKTENEIYITQSWANKAKTNEFHQMHKHPNSILSGVLFFTGKEGDGLPPIKFHRSHDLFPLNFEYEELNEFNTEARWFEPVEGRLILFPSVVEHDVDKNESDIDRITLSFNTFVRGSLGRGTRLTQVNIPR